MAYYRINDILVSGTTISSLSTNSDILLRPDGSGSVDVTRLVFDDLAIETLSSATGINNNDILVMVSDPTGVSSTLKITGQTLRSTLLNQPAQLQFRQGTEAERLLVTPASGEPIWITDTKKFFIGDGTTAGGISIGDNSGYAALSGALFSGLVVIPSGTGNFNNLSVNNIAVSVSGHTHNSSDITNFNSSVSGLLPSVTGSGYITSNFSNNIYTIGVTGLQPSGNYSVVGHSHLSSDITDFNSAVSGLIPPSNFTSLSGISGILVTNSGTDYTVSLTDPTIQLSEITDLSSDARTFLITSSSDNLRTLVTDETGSGVLVFNNSPTFSGVPLVPTATSGTNNNQIASTAFVRTEISNLVDSAPSTLDTLNELATALGDDPNFATTITNILAGKANLNGAIFTGPVTIPSGTGNFNILTVNNTGVSLNGHSHVSNDISDFSSSVSGLLPSVSGVGYVNSSFNNNTYTISVTGLQPSGNYSLVGHNHTTSDITDFNNAVSGLIPVKNILSGTGITVYNASGIYTIEATGSGILSDQAKSLVTTVFNNTGSPIPKMTAVYINGGQGDMPTVALAIATTDMTSAGTYGLTYEAIPNMESGQVIVFGSLTGLDTDQFNPTAPTGNVNGSVVYLSPSVSGSLTLTKPSAPNHIVAIGTIIRTHQNEGVIEVRVQNGFELEELHNVAISGVTNGQFLQYNSGTQLWVPSSSGNFTTLQVSGTLVPTGVGITNHITYWNGTNSIAADSGQLVWDSTNNRLGIGIVAPSSTLDVIGESRMQGVLYFNQNNTDATDASRNRCRIERLSSQNLSLTGGGNDIQLAGDAGKLILRSSSVGTEIGSSYANTYVMFNPGNSEKARITSAGNLGIGFTAPSGKLGINGGVTVGANYNLNPPSNGAIIEGNVGIANNAPSFPLDVSGVIRSSSYITANSDFRLNNQAFSRVGHVDTNGGFVGGYNVYMSGLTPLHNSTGSVSACHYYSDGSVRFLSNSSQTSNTTASERVRITSAGRMGINTTTPSGFLDVAGDVYIRGTANNLGTAYFKSAATSDTRLKVRADANGNLYLDAFAAYVRVGSQDGAAELKTDAGGIEIGQTYNASSTAQNIRFTPANTERVRITNLGRVGIGTTTPSGQLHVVGTGIFSSRLGIGTTNPSVELDVVGGTNISGTLSISGVPIAEIIDDEVAGLLVAGTGISLNYDDSGNTLTINANTNTINSSNLYLWSSFK